MLDSHTFRAAGRAGRVNHVGKVLRPGDHCGLLRRGVRNVLNADHIVHEAVGKLALGEDDRRFGIVEHELNPIFRICGIQCEVRGARLQRTHDGAHQIERVQQVCFTSCWGASVHIDAANSRRVTEDDSAARGRF